LYELAVEIEALKGAPFFADLAVDDLEAILKVAERAGFEEGDAIVTEGEIGDAMYVMLEGTAEVDVGGRFHSLTTGAFFGEMALITSKKRLATVKATGHVEALRIPADAFRSFLMEHPSVSLSMMKAIVERLREVEQRIDAWMAS
jgi:CRP-like cAMP-binding protein